MSRIDELERDLAVIARELRGVREETSTASAVAEAAKRRLGRLNLADENVRAGWRRLAPDVSPLLTDPRVGEAPTVDLAAGLLARLRRSDPVADSLGNTDLYIGQANILSDPDWEQFVRASLALTTSYMSVCKNAENGVSTWEAKYTSSSSASATIYADQGRLNQEHNLFNSAKVRLTLQALAAGTHEIVLQTAQDFSPADAGLLHLSYLVVAVRVARGDEAWSGNVTTAELDTEIWDQTAGSSLVKTTRGLQAALVGKPASQMRCYASSYWPGLSTAVQAHAFRVRYTFRMVTTATVAILLYLGEPQLHFAYSPDPAPFAPIVPSFVPRTLHNANAVATTEKFVMSRLFGDTAYRFDAEIDGRLAWSDGTTQDLRLQRDAAKQLTVDDNAGGATAKFRVRGTLELGGGGGATAATRWVGATASGAPASGTYATGDFIIDQTGKVWICTAAGTPGTWTQVGGSSIVSATKLAADYTNATATSTVVTGLNTAVGVGTWKFEYLVLYQHSAAGSAVDLSVNHSGTVSAFVANWRWAGPGTTAATGNADQAASASTGNIHESYAARAKSAAATWGPILGVDLTNSDMLAIVEGLVIVTVAGNLELWMRSPSGVGTLTVRTGSALILTKVA